MAEAGGYLSTMSFKFIKFEVNERIALITLNRPDAGNAINRMMAAEIREASLLINEDEAVRVVIITGAGERDFCIGADMSEFISSVDDGILISDEFSEFVLYNNVTEAVRYIQCPVIAAINGSTMGMGLALTLSCDLRIASDKSSFGVPDVAQGYLFASGITQWLPRIVGRAKALEMMLTTDTVDAQEALRIGLVHKVLQHREIQQQAQELAGRMVSGAPIAMRYAKEAVHKGMDMTLEQGLRLECDLYMLLHTTVDRTEGIKAFLEKRTPHFLGE
jgi:enoyl-CoA hydratase